MKKTSLHRRRRGKKKYAKKVGGVVKSIYKMSKPFHKKIARAGLYAGGAALSAYTGNPGPMAGARIIDEALITRRNRHAGAVAAHPTGSKM